MSRSSVSIYIFSPLGLYIFKSILVISAIRRLNESFPLRPFVPLLVQTLQDSDGSVRECSRKNIISIFTGSSVSDIAKADLKKELEKQNVRKTITEDVLCSVLASKGGVDSTVTHPACLFKF